MKKIHDLLFSITVFACTASLLYGCKGNAEKETAQEVASDSGMRTDESDIEMKKVTVGAKTYNVANISDQMAIYRKEVARERCFIIISKREYRLYVYEVSTDRKDTSLVAHFPICYAVNKEAKTRSGDMCTPESSLQAPFKISQIQDASKWFHDFGDGRGSILAYGAWFLRLETPGFTGVGIHGSTNNPASIPGRDSEGCIRLRDDDLLKLHDLYVQVGTPVIIKSYQQKKMPFELKAEKALGNRFQPQTIGYSLPQGIKQKEIDSDSTLSVSLHAMSFHAKPMVEDMTPKAFVQTLS